MNYHSHTHATAWFIKFQVPEQFDEAYLGPLDAALSPMAMGLESSGPSLFEVVKTLFISKLDKSIFCCPSLPQMALMINSIVNQKCNCLNASIEISQHAIKVLWPGPFFNNCEPFDVELVSLPSGSKERQELLPLSQALLLQVCSLPMELARATLPPCAQQQPKNRIFLHP